MLLHRSVKFWKLCKQRQRKRYVNQINIALFVASLAAYSIRQGLLADIKADKNFCKNTQHGHACVHVLSIYYRQERKYNDKVVCSVLKTGLPKLAVI